MNSKVANAYHTKDGGIIIPLDQFAREELKQGPDYVNNRVQIDKGSVLTFKRQLPRNLSIKGESKVELDANTFVRDTVIKDSRVQIAGNGVINLENTSIDHSKIGVSSDYNGDISNYRIKDSLLKGYLHLASVKGNSCERVYGHDLQALNSNINGGVYDDVAFIDSNIDQPGSTLIYDSTIKNSSIVNHEQTNKHWSALNHDAEHQIGETSINHSLIMNDRHHHVFTSGCKINDAISINGLISELSDIYGPKNKIVLNNLDMTADKLDFQSNPTSVLAAGSKLLNPHVHENDVYYTEIPQHRTFTPTKHNHNFKDIHLSNELVDKIDHFATETNDHDVNQAAITQLDHDINQELTATPTKTVVKSQDESLGL